MIGYSEHIYVYYKYMLSQMPTSLGFALLRNGYYQASRGIWHPENNLFEA